MAVPLLMVGPFTLAIVCATAHHLFSTHLNGQTVASATLTQQVNIAAGTAFAYLVRALLVFAAGIAYAQLLWHLLLKPDTRLLVSSIDSLSSLLTSLVELFRTTATWRYPSLVLSGAYRGSFHFQ